METENAGVALEQSELELVEFSGSLAGTDSVLQQLGPVLVAAGGHIIVKLPQKVLQEGSPRGWGSG